MLCIIFFLCFLIFIYISSVLLLTLLIFTAIAYMINSKNDYRGGIKVRNYNYTTIAHNLSVFEVSNCPICCDFYIGGILV